MWTLNEGETEGGPYDGEQMTAQIDFFTEQAAKGLVDERVTAELGCNHNMATVDKRVTAELGCNHNMAMQLQKARDVLTEEQDAAHAAAGCRERDKNSLSTPVSVQHSMDSSSSDSDLS